jgi:mRNA interferase MazF
MVKRGDVCWADLDPPAGRRPVVILTRDSAIPVLDHLTIVPISRTARGIPSEVPLDEAEGLPGPCVVACDNVTTIPKRRVNEEAIGKIGVSKSYALDQALRFALDIRF